MTGNTRPWRYLRLLGWTLAALILLVPFIASFFSEEVNWSPGDYLFAAVVLGGIGLLFELVIRRSKDDAYRTGALVGLLSMLLLTWSNAAVGFVGSGANTANVLYFGMLGVPLIGGALSGFTARGMFITMVLMAIVQAAITLFAVAGDLVAEDEGIPVLAINGIFVMLWAASAVLFQQAARGSATPSGLRIRSVLSILVIGVGAVLLGMMIAVEDEPGAVPLILILLGTAWLSVTHFRARRAN